MLALRNRCNCLASCRLVRIWFIIKGTFLINTKRIGCHHELQTSRGLFCVQPGHTRSSGSGPFSLDIATSAGKQRPEPPRFSRWSRKALNFGFEPGRSKAVDDTRDFGRRRLARAPEAVTGRPVAQPLPLGVSSRPEPPGAPKEAQAQSSSTTKGRHGGRV